MKKEMFKGALFGLIVFALFGINVKAETITLPTPKFNIDTTDGTASSNGALTGWWGTNNYYESYYPIFKVVSGVAVTTGLNVQIPNVNWCEGQQVHIIGRLAILENFFQHASLSHWATNGGKALTCSYKLLGAGDEMEFDCVGTGGKGFMIGFSINDYDISRGYSVGINRSVEVTCDASNLSVIENQNQNKNEIINNQNQNKDAIINNQNQNQQQTNERLDDIKDMDISERDKELPDSSSYDDYSSLENDLLDTTKDADLSILDVGLDVESSSWVWDTLTKLLQSNSIIFGMIISILSIGVIKLVLGR